jgi:hypothetical protein
MTCSTQCLNCNCAFASRRSDQKYCNANCRKAHWQKTIRAIAPINSQSSLSKRRSNLEFFDKSLRLAEELYTLPPQQRLGFMQHLIRDARSGNSQLRNILLNKYLLYAEERWLFHRRCPESYRTITQGADIYCRSFWGDSVRNVVMGVAEEPETGEVST